LITEVIPAMEKLHAHIEEAKIQYSEPEVYNAHNITAVQLAWCQLGMYCSPTDCQPALYAAAPLHLDM
jgi:hypothetical protein